MNTFINLYTCFELKKLNQRLIQIFGYNISSILLHELMYLGIEYSFKYNTSLTIDLTKGCFFINNIINKNFYINSKFLFKNFINLNNYISINKSFLIFKNIIYNIFKYINPISNELYFIISSGSRANKDQLNQIINVKGLILNSRNFYIKFPIVNCLINGLNIYEYILSTYGSRKGILDSSLKTSESGYLTRKLVENVQDIIIKEENCFTKSTIKYYIYNNSKGELILPKCNLYNNKYLYKYLLLSNKYKYINFYLYIRSVITCITGRFICSKCLGYKYLLNILFGESLGVISGESIGEPTTQIILKTFHTGGFIKLNTSNIKLSNVYIHNFKSYRYNKLMLNIKCIQFKCKLVKQFNLSIKYNNILYYLKNKILFFKNIFNVINIYINKLNIFNFNIKYKIKNFKNTLFYNIYINNIFNISYNLILKINTLNYFYNSIILITKNYNNDWLINYTLDSINLEYKNIILNITNFGVSLRNLMSYILFECNLYKSILIYNQFLLNEIYKF